MIIITIHNLQLKMRFRSRCLVLGLRHCLGYLHPESKCLDLSPSSVQDLSYLLKCSLEDSRSHVSQPLLLTWVIQIRFQAPVFGWV